MIYNFKKINFIDHPVQDHLTLAPKPNGFCNDICPDQIYGSVTKKIIAPLVFQFIKQD